MIDSSGPLVLDQCPLLAWHTNYKLSVLASALPVARLHSSLLWLTSCSICIVHTDTAAITVTQGRLAFREWYTQHILKVSFEGR